MTVAELMEKLQDLMDENISVGNVDVVMPDGLSLTSVEYHVDTDVVIVSDEFADDQYAL